MTRAEKRKKINDDLENIIGGAILGTLALFFVATYLTHILLEKLC